MTLRGQLRTTGQFLFRFRGYLPMLVLAALVALLWRTVPANCGPTDYLWRAAAVSVTVAGLALRCVTIGRAPPGTSGRNTKRQKASTLNTTGTYSIVRNPLYVANTLVWIGVTLLLADPLLTVAFAAALLVYYALVVFAEEEYLAEQFGDQYERYAAGTPAFVPRRSRWTPWDRPFSWRMVLRREHDSMFSAATGLLVVFHFRDVLSHAGHFLLRREWFIPWAVLACVWAVLKVLKRKTRLLRVARPPRKGQRGQDRMALPQV